MTDREADVFISEVFRRRRGFAEAVTRTARDIGHRMVEAIRERISDPYPPASSPYDYPARRTGRLKRSIKAVVELTGSSYPRVAQIRIVHDHMIAPYGDAVEHGHMEGKRGPKPGSAWARRAQKQRGARFVAPRPHIAPVVAEFMSEMQPESIAALVAGYRESELPANWS